MTVVHLILADASLYDRTCASIDGALDRAASRTFEIRRNRATSLDGRSPADLPELLRRGATILHLHGTKPPAKLLGGLTIPWVADRRFPLPRSLFRRIPPPAAILDARGVPEAVQTEWFATKRRVSHAAISRVGSLVRSPETRNHAEQAHGRIRRFRDDVDWILYETRPTPQDLSELDLWVDPASSDDDLDGMVGEALACLTPVVASRTAPNVSRLDNGKAGALTPVGDPNELTHTVLNLLFKEEVAAPLAKHASQVRERFRPARRHEALRQIYEEIRG